MGFWRDTMGLAMFRRCLTTSGVAPAVGLVLLLGASACHREDAAQLQVVQTLAKELNVSKRITQRIGCGLLVKEQRELLTCDGMIQTLLHYAPGFPGSTVTARAHSTGGWFGHIVQLPVHYESAGGRGNLQVQLRREGKDWRIAVVVPEP